MGQLSKKPLIFANIADIPSPESPVLPTRISGGHAEEAGLPSSWVAEDSKAAEEADSVEEASEVVVSEAVEPEAGFSTLPLVSS